MNCKYSISEDFNYWNSLMPPKVPNEYEVSIFEKHIEGKVLLLGETKALRKLANEGIDLFPSDFAKKGDWFDIEGFYDTIIGDGALNFETGLCLIDSIKKHCNKFIVRVFTPEIKNDYIWKYAKCFPNEFPNSSEIIKTQKGCCIVIWDFR